MASNAAQVDFEWERPQQAKAVAPYMQANGSLRAFGNYATEFKPTPPVPLNVLGVEINWIPDGRAFPEAVLDAIRQLFTYASLDEDWDSYGATALDRAVVGPVLQLVFAGHQRGRTPRLTPLNNGGVGLRWESDRAEVEVDILSERAIEITVEDLETGEVREMLLANVDEAQRLVETVI